MLQLSIYSVLMNNYPSLKGLYVGKDRSNVLLTKNISKIFKTKNHCKINTSFVALGV